MSNSFEGNSANKKSGPNCFAIGCASIIGLVVLSNVLGALAGADGLSTIPFLIVLGFVVFAVVKSRRNAKSDEALGNLKKYQESQRDTSATNKVAAELPMLLPSSASTVSPTNSSTGQFRNPICDHRFTGSALKTETVSCECGHQFSSEQLREFNELQTQLMTIEDRLRALTAAIRSFAISAPSAIDDSQVAPKFEAAAQVAPSSAVVEPELPQRATNSVTKTAPPKPIKPTISRPKVNLSLQQWLIIGASILVMVAGSIFVSYGISQDWPPIVFAAVTVSISALTAFGAFKLKAISVMLTNFAAIFSASMVTATLMVLGDNIFTGELDFVWDSAPAWWWAISLLIVSAMSTVLAKGARNFGYKAVAILTSATSIAVFVVGFLYSMIQVSADFFGLYVAGMSVAAIAILYQGKFLLSIEHDQVANKEFKAYAQQLVERETKSLRALTLIGSGSLAAIGISLAIIQAGASILVPANPLALLAVAAVWFVLGMRSESWSQLLTKENKPTDIAKTVANSTTLISVILAITSATTWVPDQVLRNVGALVVLSVVVWFVGKVKVLAITQLQTQIAMWVSLGAFTFWTIGKSDLLGYGVLFIMVALLLTSFNIRFRTSLYQVAAFALHGFGTFLLFGHYVATTVVPAASVAYAALALVFVLATNLQLVIQAVIAKRLKLRVSPILGWLGLAFAGAMLYLMYVPLSNWFEYGLDDRLPMIFTFLVYAASAFAVIAFTKFGESNRLLITLHSYLGQLVTVLAVVNALIFQPEVATTTAIWLVAALALINYGYGWLASQSVHLQVGFVTALVAFYTNQFAGVAEPSVLQLNLQIVLVAAATYLHVFAWRKRVQAVTARSTTGLVFAVIPIGLVVSFLGFSQGLSATFVELLSINLVLSALAIGAAITSEMAARKGNSTSAKNLLGLSFVYAGVSVLSNLVGINSDDTQGLKLRAILTFAVLAGLALRQVVRQQGALYILIGYASNLAIAGFAASITQTLIGTGSAPETYSLWFAVAIAGTTLLLGKHMKQARSLLLLDVPVVGVALTSQVYAISLDVTTNDSILRGLISSLLLATYAYFRSSASRWLLLAGYIFGAGSALWLSQAFGTWFAIEYAGVEPQSLLIALSVYLGNLVLVRRASKASAELRWSAIVAILTLPSLFWALTHDATLPENQIRQILALVAIAAFAVVIRKASSSSRVWIAISYAANLFAALTIAQASYSWFTLDYSGPEIFSFAAAVSLMVSYLLLKSDLAAYGRYLIVSAPIVALSIPSLIFSFTQPNELIETQLRRVLALALISLLTIYLSKNTQRKAFWAIGSYFAIAATAVSVANASYQVFAIDFAGPEIYSIAVALGVVISRRLTRNNLKFEGSMFTWGLPLGIMVIPSTVYTFASLQLPLAQLSSLEITRVILVLAISAALLVLGIRRGNLASTSIGLLGLGFVLLPATAVHSSEVVPGVQLESTALVAGVLIFVLLSVLHQRKVLKGTSAIYIGIPVTIAIAPALVNSLIALGNPTLGSVDWWRFSIVLAAGLTLLIVGSLRELAGMFYPGLAAVLLSALPYGFKQTQDQAWFLWVLLLLVAGVMVWVAVRLEQIKKAGRSSTAWLKELR